MSERVWPDAPPVRRDEAIVLMVHHLLLAAMYFENTPDDNKVVTADVRRILDAHEVSLEYSPGSVAVLSWLEYMQKKYVEMSGEAA